MKKYEQSTLNDDIISNSLKNDVLSRKKDIVNLSKLLNCIDENYVISIDGVWGTGKTFFIKQMIYCFNNDVSSIFNKSDYKIILDLKDKYIPIYYNAWSNDDHDDVVESLIYNILNEYPKYRNDILFDKSDLKNAFEDFWKNFIEKSSLGFINKEMLSNFRSIKDLSDRIITYEEKKNCLHNLLDKLVYDDSRLLLIIDELDRCKPDYAVKIIETIKHFYDYNKITIVVSTDNSQLSKCVQHFYGANFDGYGYLNKIYDTVLTLTLKNRDRYLETYCNFIDDEVSSQIALALIDYYDMSLRECNRFVSMYDLSYNYISMSDNFSQNKFVKCSSFFLILGIVLKLKDINEFYNFIRGNSDDYVLNIMKNIIEIKPYLSSWFIKQLAGDNQLPNNWKKEDEIIRVYHEIFKSTQSFMAFSMIEALSLIGNRIIVNE